MKNSTAEKIALMAQEFKERRSVFVTIRGVTEELLVKDLRKRNHTLDLALDRNGGTIVVDPDDIAIIRLHKAI